MPQELPGFYYDAEKNRYFPIKGPIPGSSRIASSSSSCSTTAQKKLTDHKQISKAHKGLERTSAKMLQSRELCGNAIISTKRKYNFREEYQKSQVSEPMIWRYDHTTKMADCALEHVHVDVDTPDGALRTEILIAGGLNGFFSLSEIGKDVRQFNFGVASTPDPVVLKEGSAKSPEHLWWPERASVNMESTISCIKMFKKLHPHSTGVVASKQHALITTLGSETSGGSVYILDLSDSMEFNTRFPLSRRLNKISLFNCTIWTADGNFDGHQAAIGTNLGAALVNIETGAPSWFFRSKSDVLSLQLDHSGNNVLCGLRNGAIVTVDVRQKPDGHARLARQRIPLHSRKIKKTSSRSQNLNKQWFEFKGDLYNSCTVAMPSSISCLASLKLYDQYFLASSMDGSIKLYDHRLTQKGAVQSYEGHVNSHTRIQLGVDPSEKFIISGGEDCKLRIWSFKSGELLFEEKFMNTTPSVVCWQRNDGCKGSRNEYVEYDETLSGGAWIGSQEGLFHMKWS